jgi:Sec-independent protein translocase protein TatA
MNLFRIVFELFALYLLYKLVFDFIIPVAKTTKQVKKQFSEMNATMQEQMKRQQSQQAYPPNNYSSNTAAPAPKKNDDYIDFEEVK